MTTQALKKMAFTKIESAEVLLTLLTIQRCRKSGGYYIVERKVSLPIDSSCTLAEPSC